MLGIWTGIIVASLAQAPADLLPRVLAAVAPALPFPRSDADGLVPEGDLTAPRWMIRPLAPGDAAIDVIANPLNREVQSESARAMREIEQAIEAAQRTSQAQYERAVEEARRTGRSQDVDGVTLADEGAAGERIDAESRVTIEVLSGAADYSVAVAASIEPRVDTAMAGAVAAVRVPGHLCRAGDEAPEHYCQADTLVLVGAISRPTVKARGRGTYEVTASSGGGFIVRMRGNTDLIAAIAARADWASLTTPDR